MSERQGTCAEAAGPLQVRGESLGTTLRTCVRSQDDERWPVLRGQLAQRSPRRPHGTAVPGTRSRRSSRGRRFARQGLETAHDGRSSLSRAKAFLQAMQLLCEQRGCGAQRTCVPRAGVGGRTSRQPSGSSGKPEGTAVTCVTSLRGAGALRECNGLRRQGVMHLELQARLDDETP